MIKKIIVICCIIILFCCNNNIDNSSKVLSTFNKVSSNRINTTTIDSLIGIWKRLDNRDACIEFTKNRHFISYFRGIPSSPELYYIGTNGKFLKGEEQDSPLNYIDTTNRIGNMLYLYDSISDYITCYEIFFPASEISKDTLWLGIEKGTGTTYFRVK
jgi:hypothetical protein